MNSIETLATFFGLCAVINFGILLFGFLFFGIFKEGVANLTAKIFGISEQESKVTIFRVFQQYRLAFVIFNLIPYFALTIMS